MHRASFSVCVLISLFLSVNTVFPMDSPKKGSTGPDEENTLCYGPMFDYKIITADQDIGADAEKIFQEVQSYVDDGRYDDARTKIIPFRGSGGLRSAFASNKKAEYSCYFFCSLAYYLSNYSAKKDYHCTILDKVVSDDSNSDPWIQQICCLSKLLQGFQLTRTFMSRDHRKSQTELQKAEKLLRPFVVEDPDIIVRDSNVIHYYWKLLGGRKLSDINKFSLIVGGAKDNYPMICKRVDALSRYYLGIVLFCLSPVTGDSLSEITDILSPLENSSYKSMFDQHRQDIIAVITAACLGKTAIQGEKATFTPEETESIMSLDEGELRRLLGTAQSSK